VKDCGAEALEKLTPPVPTPPDCFAVMVTGPLFLIVTRLLMISATEESDDSKVTARPLLEDADKSKESPTDFEGIVLNVIDCV